MGSQSHYDNPNYTMKLFVLACVVLSAMAEPEAEADPQLVRHWNGAVTPLDTPSVQIARAAHLTAKANAYAYRPYSAFYNYGAYPAYGAYHGIFRGKRDAEADAEPQYYSGLTYGNYYGAGYPYTYGAYGAYRYPTATSYGAYPYSYPTYGGLYRGKRDAEADAEPQYYSGLTYGNYYGAGYPATYGAYGAYRYPATYASSVAYPYNLPTYGGLYRGKRDAEADAEPQYYGNYYGNYYGARAYPSAYGAYGAYRYPAAYSYGASAYRYSGFPYAY